MNQHQYSQHVFVKKQPVEIRFKFLCLFSLLLIGLSSPPFLKYIHEPTCFRCLSAQGNIIKTLVRYNLVSGPHDRVFL